MSDNPKFYLQWTAVNWITVLLMVTVGWLVIGAAASGIRQVRARGAASDD